MLGRGKCFPSGGAALPPLTRKPLAISGPAGVPAGLRGPKGRGLDAKWPSQKRHLPSSHPVHQPPSRTKVARRSWGRGAGGVGRCYRNAGGAWVCASQTQHSRRNSRPPTSPGCAPLGGRPTAQLCKYARLGITKWGRTVSGRKGCFTMHRTDSATRPRNLASHYLALAYRVHFGMLLMLAKCQFWCTNSITLSLVSGFASFSFFQFL